MQLGGNDGTCVLKGSLAMCMVHDPGIKYSTPTQQLYEHNGQLLLLNNIVGIMEGIFANYSE